MRRHVPAKMMAPLAGVMFAVVVSLAWAPETRGAPGEIRVVALGRPGGAELLVRGQPVARLHGAGAVPRANAAARVLDPLLPSSPTVEVKVVRGRAHVVVGGRIVLSVDRRDAEGDGTAPAALARRWASDLTAALAVPPITLSRSSLALPPGGAATISVTGAASGRLDIGEHDGRVADVKVIGRTLRVVGRAQGTTVIPIRLGPYRAALSLAVRPPAGVIPSSAEVIVTGVPATPGLIREAVERRLHQVVGRAPGATLARGPIDVPGPLAPHEAVSVPVGVALRAPERSPVQGTVRFAVTNTALRLIDPEVLLVSNRPETITGNGLLFHETLTPGRAARLLYHHLNGTSQMRVLKITLSNPREARARVHYLSGLAGPSPDPLSIGHLSTARFFDAFTSGRGYVVDIPPKGSTAFIATALPPQALVSGLMQLQLIDGGPIDLVVHVRLPYLLDRTVTADLGPWAFPHPRGTFPGSSVVVTRDVPVHRPADVAELGVMSDLRDVRTGEPLVGDYGVLYRLRLKLVNPTDREVTSALLANAAGGTARGVFLIDGAPTDIGVLRATEERAVATFAVQAGGTREVHILTMPVAGSFYPVRLTLQPR